MKPWLPIQCDVSLGVCGSAAWSPVVYACRETGDHGPINSWDRNAFISDVKYGTPSYTAEMNHVDHNMIIANYGASQGFDTDDGSSWYDIHDNFVFQGDGWKMDYGGHDSAFHDNIVYVGASDGQNCVNAGTFLPGHGVGWYKNKCIVTDSKNIGTTGGCDCPGNGKPSPGGGVAPQGECGLTMHDNEYFGDPKIPGNMTMTCGGAILASTWLESGSDKGSAVYEIPDDDTLIGWAREKLDLPAIPAPPPPPPTPLPPQPPPTFPDTCVGRCWREGHCCANMVSGCNQPTCYQGCALAQVTASIAACKAACTAAGGHCSYSLKNVTLQMCDQCASVTPPQECSKKVRKTPLFAPFIHKNDHFYQDRLGANIGKTQKRVVFFLGRVRGGDQLPGRLHQPLRTGPVMISSDSLSSKY